MSACVVVLRPLGLGDFLTGVPAYRAIARAFPDHRRVLAAPRALHALVPFLGPTFFEAIDVAPLAALPQATHGADVAIDLHGRGPASQRILLATHPRRLVSFAHDDLPQTHTGATWRADEHEVGRWCRMLAHAGIAADPRELAIDVPDAEPHDAGATIVHPGAASRARRWPIERWADVTRALVARGERVVITGAADERDLGLALARASGLDDADVRAGRTDLVQLAALVAHARRIVCGDTGIAHLASAYRTPSVILFGPTPPAQWGPPRHSRHRVLWAGRCGNPHADTTDAGLLAIDAARVLVEIDRLDASA